DLLEGAGIVVLDAHPVAGHEVVEAAKGAPGRPHAHGVASEPDDVGWSAGDGGGDQLLRVQVALSAGCAHDDPDMGVALFEGPDGGKGPHIAARLDKSPQLD